MTKAELRKLLKSRFKRQALESNKLYKKLDSFRPKYNKLRHDGSQNGLKMFSKVCSDMQRIQTKIECLWKPAQRFLGGCPICGAVRMPAVFRGKDGLGCLNSNCYHFERLSKQVS